MSCFKWYGSEKDVKPPKGAEVNIKKSADDQIRPATMVNQPRKALSDRSRSKSSSQENKQDDASKMSEPAVQEFLFRELAVATKNFHCGSLLGKGGFGRVYKGSLESTGQIVAVKQLDRNGSQGHTEFLVELLMLTLLHHPNLVSLIGYCAGEDQMLLVYEYLPLGSLENHLHDLPPDKEALDWNTRMKIALGAAKGLEYMHETAVPPVICRDFKSSNILLDEEFYPKLSDFGLAKFETTEDNPHVSTQAKGTFGYCAPEYVMTGQLTVKSDVYSFGVVLLELITGRKAIDDNRLAGEQYLVAWARHMFTDRRNFAQMADPRLQGRYPMKGLYQALAVAAMCLQEEAATRPMIVDVVEVLGNVQTYTPAGHPAQNIRASSSTPPREKRTKERKESDGSDRENNRVSRRGSNRSSLSLSEGSPDHRPARVRVLNGLNESGGSQEGSGRDSGDSDWSDGMRDSPRNFGRASRDGNRISALSQDRERAVAEAKSRGKNLRERKKGNALGGTNGRIP